ncbi:hypothetical protein Leryth_011510 [Lithospermum erythrorhizon]|nr:hypothetical protein Leryth_011510 [Lithospermum erythrorhizon]
MTKGKSWVDLYLPETAQHYARLARMDKPIGTWLALWPCLWGIAFAANPGSLPDMKILSILSVWVFLIRGAGCTINDIFDRDFDKKVARTKLRPIASGALTRVQGIGFLVFQLILGIGILVEVNQLSQILGVLHLPLVMTYPLMKRITYWPQAYLGFAMNWGVLLGWASIKGNLYPTTLVVSMLFCGVFWTLAYDTIYAHQDKEDDIKVGVKSTALRLGDSTKKWVTVFSIACMCNLVLCGLVAKIGWPYYASLVVGSWQLIWQIWKIDLSSPEDCNKKFVSNWWFGAIIFVGIVYGQLIT